MVSCEKPEDSEAKVLRLGCSLLFHATPHATLQATYICSRTRPSTLQLELGHLRHRVKPARFENQKHCKPSSSSKIRSTAEPASPVVLVLVAVVGLPLLLELVGQGAPPNSRLHVVVGFPAVARRLRDRFVHRFCPLLPVVVQRVARAPVAPPQAAPAAAKVVAALFASSAVAVGARPVHPFVVVFVLVIRHRHGAFPTGTAATAAPEVPAAVFVVACAIFLAVPELFVCIVDAMKHGWVKAYISRRDD